MQFIKGNLNINYNPFSQNSVFNVKPKMDIQKPKKDLQTPPKTILCNEVVTWKENYFADTQAINEQRGPKYLCTECSESFNSRLSFLTHSKIHMKPFCVLCGKYSETKTEMYSHMKMSHAKFVQSKFVQCNLLNSTNKDQSEQFRKQHQHCLPPAQNASKKSPLPTVANLMNVAKYNQTTPTTTTPTTNADHINFVDCNGQKLIKKIGRPRKIFKTSIICESIDEMKIKRTTTSRSGRCITMKVLD